MSDIYEVKTYTDLQNKEIVGFKKRVKDNEVGYTRYQGRTTLLVSNGPNTEQKPMSFKFVFPEGMTLEECFDKFDKTLEEALETMKREEALQASERAKEQAANARAAAVVGATSVPPKMVPGFKLVV